MKKSLVLIMLTIFLTACGTSSSNKNNTEFEAKKVDTTKVLNTVVVKESKPPDDSIDYNNATYYLVIADTSKNYFELQKKMFEINQKLNISIDTMGRFYNKSKNLIAFPDNDVDEIYAGDYFPRRFPSKSISLEYLDFYKRKSGEKTIALVTGIYETEKSADSALTNLNRTENKAFKIKADIYIGCMH
jgi:hypothetical protein